MLLPSLLLVLSGCVAPIAFDDPEGDWGDDTSGGWDSGDTGPLEAWDSGDTGEDDEMEARWQAFLDEREAHLRALGEPILYCTRQQDTNWPVFHGCYDWHSAVHGVYSLHAIGRLTGDDSYLDAAEALLENDGLARELAGIRGGSLGNELPYGFAWFLALARERERATGATDAAELAAELGDRLVAWMDGLSEAGFASAVGSDDYDNLSWALLNVWQQAQWDGDDERAAAMEAHAERLLGFDAALPLERDVTDDDDFFPPSLHRARTIAEVLPAETTEPWAADFLPADFQLAPVQSPASAHQSGLNFSRAWGLWSLWRLTGDPQWRALYLDHVEAWMAKPQYWAEDYYSYSHWVPQFGVYAIALSFED